jgi:hypothetical protein
MVVGQQGPPTGEERDETSPVECVFFSDGFGDGDDIAGAASASALLVASPPPGVPLAVETAEV